MNIAIVAIKIEQEPINPYLSIVTFKTMYCKIQENNTSVVLVIAIFEGSS